MEDVDKNIMDRAPKPKNEGIFAHGFGIQIILQGCMFGILTLIAFWMGENWGGSTEAGQTMAFIVLAFSQIVQAFNMRSERSLFTMNPFGNKSMSLAALATLVLTAGVLFIPGVNTIFGLTYLKPINYVIALGLVLVPLVIMEVSKAIGLISHKH
jgi:Ca2+-transporting ATPase